uniref:Uncharacterized protein TCIL3000_10_11880 n=1 Tax=Trypanosoma congolense (strain IL3000) TaxID=1068625 RepID=G0UYE0_TRYCI|nr:unnamed protein product [Trypanosoma congolense IL3000]
MATVEELQQVIREEQEKHAQVLEELRSERESLSSLLAEQQQYIQELITRLTDLRTQKCDRMLSSEQLTQRIEINTGCAVVDEALRTVENGLNSSSSKRGVVLGKIWSAMMQAIVPSDGKKSSSLSTSSSATRTTNVAVITRNMIRGTNEWVKRHCKKCSPCGELNKKPRPWEPAAKTEKGKSIKGCASVPNLSCVPGKNFRSVSLYFAKETANEVLLELLRISSVINIQGSGGAAVANPKDIATQVTGIVTELVQGKITEAREAAKRAPWSTGPSANEKFSSAVEMLLHNLDVKVSVTVPEPNELRSAVPRGQTPLKITVLITAPRLLSILQPFVEMWGDPQHRTYILDCLLKPTVLHIAELFGMTTVAEQSITVAFKAVDVLTRITRGRVMIETDTKGSPKSKSSPQEPQSAQLLSCIHSVVLGFALFGTRLTFECAIPKLEEANTLKGVKRGAFDIARSFLQRLLPPKRDIAVSLHDPTVSDFVILLLNAPTRLLEILNNSFSSARRLPSTSRTSVVDHLASPRLKINYALRTFADIVIDFPRPYAPNSGMMTTAEKAKGEKERLGPCAPVVDLPPDLVRANVEVVQWAEEKLRNLLEKEAIDVSTGTGEEIAKSLGESVMKINSVSGFLGKLQQLSVSVVDLTDVRVDVCLPCGAALCSPGGGVEELLYLRVDTVRNP